MFVTDFSGISMANISKHLTLMRRTGIVVKRKAGNQVYYNLRNRGILDIFGSVCKDIESRFVGEKALVKKAKGQPSSTAPTAEESPIEPAEEKEDIEIVQPRLKGLNGNTEE